MTNKVLRIYGYIAVLAATAASLGAVEYTWDKGAGTLDWNDPVNWSSDTKPGINDIATFTATGITAGNTVLLGADQTIGSLKFNSSVPTITIGDASLPHSLTLKTGVIADGGYWNFVRTTTIAAPLILGANGAFAGYGTYGAQLVFDGPISDGGNGYSVVFSDSTNYDFTFRGNNTYTGDTVLRGKSLTISGTNGAILSSRLVFRAGDTPNRMDVFLNNSTDVNTNRLSNTLAIRNERGISGVSITGNASTAVEELAGPLEILNGGMQLRATYNGANVALKFSSLDRAEGTSLVFDYQGTGVNAGTNAKLGFVGAVTNAAGIWQPWAIFGGDTQYDPVHSTVDTNGTLKRFSNYVTLLDSGGESTKVYQAAAASQTLTASQEIYALLMRRSGDATLDLGSYDLRLAGGSVGFSTHGSKTIQSSGGGRLVFGTPDVVIFGTSDNSAKTLTISSPIASDVAGPHNLIIPLVRVISRLSLTGEDQIGTYSKISADMANISLELGGPSDRAVTNTIYGRFNLIKSGPGTLRMAATDYRNGGTTTIVGGRLAVGNVSGVYTLSYGESSIIVTNAILEVESGITWAKKFTLQANSTLTGDGKFNSTDNGKAYRTIPNTVHVAPGKNIGTLKTAALTFSTGSHLDWELGAGTTTAGTDYDLLRVEGNLVLPDNTAMTVDIYDAGNGVADVRGKTFTLVEWTGTDPATTPTWTIVNHSEATLNTTDAVITVDTANNKIVMSGLKNVYPGATVIMVR